MPETLLHRIAAGDASAVQECLDRYGGMVWSLARRFARGKEDAEDAAQDVFVEIWRKAARYDPTLSSEAAFVGMIARRRLIDRSRRTRRDVDVVEIDPEVPSSSAARAQEEVELCDEAAHARGAFERLRPEQQKVLKLAIYDGLSYEEIARAISMPLGTVKTHARRGLKRVREILGASTTAAAKGASS